MKSVKSPYIKVRKSKIHGTGIYAKKNISKGTTIIEYIGKKITKKESEKIYSLQYDKHKKNKQKGAVYIFELNKKWDIDGNIPENTARYINHSCNPNAEAANTGKEIIIEALRNIKKGEEITYNYGYDIENFEEHPCKCGTKKCVGFIVEEEQWPELRKRIKEKGLRKRKKKNWLQKLFC